VIQFSGSMDSMRIEDRLSAIEDREEIHQLLMDYGRYLDKRDFLSFSKLFAEHEGEWIGGMGSAKGSENIRKLMEETIGTMPVHGPNFHIFSNEIISLQGDRAWATSKWMFITQSDDNRPQIALMGRYEDSLIRENGAWKFLQRKALAGIPKEAGKS
jgi:hypothetical protein